jgi:WD40 repeat protein
MRIVTCGQEDGKCFFHQGPPFARVAPVDGIPSETAHAAGTAVNCVRYNSTGTFAISVGSDKSLCLYEGKTFTLLTKLEHIHESSIYTCAWSANDQYILTASADGTCKLLEYSGTVDTPLITVKHSWNVASALQEARGVTPTPQKVPVGAMQLGCAFVNGETPVSVSLNGQLAILPIPGSEDKIKIVTGHAAPIASMAVSSDCKSMYTGDTDGIICKWNLETFQPTSRLDPPEGDEDLMYKIHGGAAVSALAICGKILLSVGWDDKMRIADDNDRIRLESTSLPAQPNVMVSGTNIAAILTVGNVVIVNQEGKIVGSTFKQNYEAVSAVLSRDDKSLYIGDSSGKIHVYEITDSFDLREIQVIEKGHQKAVHSLCLSNDQTKLASADVRDICVWDVASTYSPLVSSRWCFHTQRITALAWSPDDKILASGGADDSIYLWSLENKAKRIHYPFCHRGGISGLSFLNLSRLVSVGADACVNQWDVAKDVAKIFS